MSPYPISKESLNFYRHLNRITEGRHDSLTNLLTYLDYNYSHNGDCSRCGGSGKLPEYWYRDAGVCYSCGGSGSY